MKKIILVTHGKKEQDLPNPGLTDEGKKQMEKLKSQLPGKFDYVISGIGERHKGACLILVGRKADLETELVGMPETLSSDGKYMIFPDGKKIPFEEWEKTRYRDTLKKIPPFLKQILSRSEKNILIVGGRIAVIGAEIHPEKVQSAHIYYIELTSSGRVRIRE